MIRPALAALLSALMLAAVPAHATITFTKPATFIAFEPESAGSLIRFDPYSGPAVSSAALTFQGFVRQDITGFIAPLDPIPTALTFNPNVLVRTGILSTRFPEPPVSVPVRVQPDRSFTAREEFSFTETMPVRLADVFDGLEVEFSIFTAANGVPSNTPSIRSLTGIFTLALTEAQSVPEPATFALLGVGLVAMWGRRRA